VCCVDTYFHFRSVDGRERAVLCVVGIIGNSMNVVVMTRRRVRHALNSRMERAARVGLLSLTIADILCCVASLVVAVGAVERTFFQSRDDMLKMLIVAYGPYVQNALAKSSTWLVVVTAVGRPVRHPSLVRYALIMWHVIYQVVRDIR